MSCSEMSSTDTESEEEVDSCNYSRDGIIYGRSDYSGWGGDSLISGPNSISSSTSTDNGQQQQQMISTAAGGGTEDDSMISVSSSDASSSWFSLNNNTNKQNDHHQDILRVLPQMQQMNNPLTRLQVYQLQLRARQQLTTRPATSMNNNTNMDNGRPLVDIKLENPNAFSMTTRQSFMQQVHYHQQRLAAISSRSTQNTIRFRPTVASLQISPVYTPNMGIARAPPVKVESFRELMGGDSSMKHDSEENK